MPVHIQSLKLRIRVRKGPRSSAHGSSEGPTDLTARFKSNATAVPAEVSPDQKSQTNSPSADVKPTGLPDPSEADPNKVAEKVFEFMKKEIRIARERGERS